MTCQNSPSISRLYTEFIIMIEADDVFRTSLTFWKIDPWAESTLPWVWTQPLRMWVLWSFPQFGTTHARKNAPHLLTTTQKYCACHTKRLLTCYETCWNVTKCHACHAKRGCATCETSKSDRCCKTRHRHGHTALMRTVATVNAASSEHTLNPQTPRVKREPLLRIRENIENTIFRDFSTFSRALIFFLLALSSLTLSLL